MAIFGPSDMIWRTSDMVPANDARPERTPARAAVPPNFEGEDEHQADLDDLADPTVQLYSSSQCEFLPRPYGGERKVPTLPTLPSIRWAIEMVGVPARTRPRDAYREDYHTVALPALLNKLLRG